MKGRRMPGVMDGGVLEVIREMLNGMRGIQEGIVGMLNGM